MSLYEKIQGKIKDLDVKLKQAGNGASQAVIAAQTTALYWVLAQITIEEAKESIEFGALTLN